MLKEMTPDRSISRILGSPSPSTTRSFNGFDGGTSEKLNVQAEIKIERAARQMSVFPVFTV